MFFGTVCIELADRFAGIIIGSGVGRRLGLAVVVFESLSLLQVASNLLFHFFTGTVGVVRGGRGHGSVW